MANKSIEGYQMNLELFSLGGGRLCTIMSAHVYAASTRLV